MDVQLLGDPAEFLDRAGAILLGDEPRNNLILGLAGVLRNEPRVYPEFSLWLVEDGVKVVGAALRTPPYGLVLGPCSTAGVAALVESIEDELPGAVGAVPEIDSFAETWAAERGVPVEVRFEQGIYALERLIEPRGVPGSARPATEADVELVRAWLIEFSRQALHEDEPDETRIERTIRQRLERREASFLRKRSPLSLSWRGGIARRAANERGFMFFD